MSSLLLRKQANNEVSEIQDYSRTIWGRFLLLLPPLHLSLFLSLRLLLCYSLAKLSRLVQDAVSVCFSLSSDRSTHSKSLLFPLSFSECSTNRDAGFTAAVSYPSLVPQSPSSTPQSSTAVYRTTISPEYGLARSSLVPFSSLSFLILTFISNRYLDD